MKFSELLQEIREAYPEQPRAFHVLATRYYLGIEPIREIRKHPALTEEQKQAIIDNR
jgi:hypothetical protein